MKWILKDKVFEISESQTKYILRFLDTYDLGIYFPIFKLL